jgi:hypothetical protein
MVYGRPPAHSHVRALKSAIESKSPDHSVQLEDVHLGGGRDVKGDALAGAFPSPLSQIHASVSVKNTSDVVDPQFVVPQDQ